jgi:hypothetical protein
MEKLLVIAPLRVNHNSYVAAVQTLDGQVLAGKFNLDTWCLTPKSCRAPRNVYPTTVKSALRPLTAEEQFYLSREHPAFAYMFVWGADEAK